MLLSLMLAGAGNSSRNAAGYTAPPAFTASQLAAPAGNDWIDFGGNSLDQRYSSLTQINRGNVGGLQVAWHVNLPEKIGTTAETSGVEYGGLYYIVVGNDDVYALNATTGATVWEWQPAVPQAGLGPKGLGIGDGNVYIDEADDYVVAINALTGQTAWKTGPVGDTTAGDNLSAPVTYANGMVFTGNSGSDAGVRGYIAAFDAKTGKQLWKTYTIPLGPKDPGYSSWGQPADLIHGGGGDWNKVVADPSLNMVYAATANAEPYANRPKGNDLYTSAIVALDMKTGALKWGYQLFHHDSWDLDASPTPPVLLNYSLGGKKVQAIELPTKVGENFIINRVTGKPFAQLPIPEVPVPQDPSVPNNSPTQPIPSGQPFAPACSTPQEWIAVGGTPSLLGPDGNPINFACNFQPVVSTHYTVPGWHDIADWPPNSYSQTTGLIYVCSTNSRGDAYEAVPQADAVLGVGNRGYGTENVSLLGGDWVEGQIGWLTAMNPRTNTIAWAKQMPDHNGCYSGSSTTASNLVFSNLFSGHLMALDAGSGTALWTGPQMDAGSSGAPTIYMGSDGREYVTLVEFGIGISKASVQGNSIYAYALPSH
jgi:alcohol dehydrogenase (cytochrome c)